MTIRIRLDILHRIVSQAFDISSHGYEMYCHRARLQDGCCVC